MSGQDIAKRIDGVLERHSISPELREKLKVELVREFAQQQIEEAQRWVHLAQAPDLATLQIRELKTKAREAGVPEYWSKTKAQLVAALAAAELAPANAD